MSSGIPDEQIVLFLLKVVTERFNSLFVNHIQALGDTEKLVCRTSYSQPTWNPLLLMHIETPYTVCEIGVWFYSQTSDITVFNAVSGDSLFEFHNNWKSNEQLLEVVRQALAFVS